MKKIRLEKFRKIPFDCWSEVVQYFESTKQWLTLILVVKGLHEYIKSNPKCMRNISFDGNNFSGGFPEQPKPFVLKFSIGNEKGETDLFVMFEEIYGCSHFMNLFEKIPSKFPNLEELQIHLSFKSEFGGEKRPFHQSYRNPFPPSQYVKLYNYFGKVFQLSEKKLQRKFDNLMKLDLVLTRMDVDLTTIIFRNLRALRVMNMGDYYNVDLSDGYPDEGLLCDQRKIFLKKECFPALQSIELHGFIVSFSISELFHTQLTELYLGHCEILERSVKNFVKLETLGIGCGGNVKEIDNLPKLTNFEFYDNGFFMDERLGRVNEAECGGFPTGIRLIRNLPNLKSLHIDNSDCLFGDEWSLIEIRDLSMVEDIYGQSCGMKILNVPNLRTVKFMYFKSLEIGDESLLKLEEFEFHSGYACEKVKVNLSMCSDSLKIFQYPDEYKQSTQIHESLYKFQNLRKLEQLELNYFCKKEVEVFNNNPKLQRLKLHFRPCGHRVDDNTDLNLKFHSPITSVKSIDIQGCSINKKASQHTQSLIENFPNLRSLRSTQNPFVFEDEEDTLRNLFTIITTPQSLHNDEELCRIANCSVEKICVGMRRDGEKFDYNSKVTTCVIENVKNLKKLRLNSMITNLRLVQDCFDKLTYLGINLTGFDIVEENKQLVIDGKRFPCLLFLYIRKDTEHINRMRNYSFKKTKLRKKRKKEEEEEEESDDEKEVKYLHFIREIRNMWSLEKVVVHDVSYSENIHDFVFCDRIIFDDEDYEDEDADEDILEFKLATRRKLFKKVGLKGYREEFLMNNN